MQSLPDSVHVPIRPSQTTKSRCTNKPQVVQHQKLTVPHSMRSTSRCKPHEFPQTSESVPPTMHADHTPSVTCQPSAHYALTLHATPKPNGATLHPSHPQMIHHCQPTLCCAYTLVSISVCATSDHSLPTTTNVMLHADHKQTVTSSSMLIHKSHVYHPRGTTQLKPRSQAPNKL